MPSMTPSSSSDSRGQFQGLGGLRGLLAVAPEDRGAAFRGNDRVDGVGQHQVHVADADAEGAAAAAFAGDHRDDRGFEHRHLRQVAGDRLGLAAGLGLDAGIGAGGVDQADHRQVATSPPASSGAGPCGILPGWPCRSCTRCFSPRVRPLLVADEHHAVISELGEAADDRPVVAEAAVAVQLDELRERVLDVVPDQRPVLVACHLDGLPRGQAIDRARRCGHPAA